MQLLVQMLLYISARTFLGAERCEVWADASNHSQGCLEASAWGRKNELTGPEGWRRVLAAYRRCEAEPDNFPLHGAAPTLLFNQGHCACWGAPPPLVTPSVVPGQQPALLLGELGISLEPSGRRQHRPRAGSDPRVSAFRLCPQEQGCRRDGCRSFDAQPSALERARRLLARTLPGATPGLPRVESSNGTALPAVVAGGTQRAVGSCAAVPAVPWCVGMHACSAVYTRRDFAGGTGLEGSAQGAAGADLGRKSLALEKPRPLGDGGAQVPSLVHASLRVRRERRSERRRDAGKNRR